MKRADSWRQARFTLGIAVVTAAAGLFIMAAGAGGQAADWGGFMPARFGDAVAGGGYAYILLGPLTAALVHVSLVHLAINLLLLVVCGRIVEAIIGGGGVLLLYIAGAYAAAAAFYLFDPESSIIFIGAAGAVGAIVGAYAMLAGRLRLKRGSPILARAINIAWLGATWIVLQGLLALTAWPRDTVAIVSGLVACAGGFLAGLLLARPLFLLKWRGA